MSYLFFLFLAVGVSFSVTSEATQINSTKLDEPSEKHPEDSESIPSTTDQSAKEETHQNSKNLSENRTGRENADYFALVNYSPLDLLIPSKIGLTFGYIQSPEKTWELEYLRGSFSVPFLVKDLGKMTDVRFSVIGRSYFKNNSFNFSYGLSYFDFNLHLGDELLNRVTAGSYPSLDLVKIQSLGFNVAVGNRWTLSKNVTFGIDWISLAQPVSLINQDSAFLDYANNQQDKDDVDQATNLISYFPRFSFLKIQLGILF